MGTAVAKAEEVMEAATAVVERVEVRGCWVVALVALRARAAAKPLRPSEDRRLCGCDLAPRLRTASHKWCHLPMSRQLRMRNKVERFHHLHLSHRHRSSFHYRQVLLEGRRYLLQCRWRPAYACSRDKSKARIRSAIREAVVTQDGSRLASSLAFYLLITVTMACCPSFVRDILPVWGAPAD